MQKKRKFDKTAFVFIAPAFIFFTLFIIVPTVSSVYYSFTSWDGVSPNVKFIGLANYKEIFTSARFGNALKNTILLTVFISVFENAFALALALIVDNVRWGKNFFRSAFYVPVLVSGIVSGFIWKIMYNYNFGTINTILKDIGMGDFRQDWLGNNKLTLILRIIYSSAVWFLKYLKQINNDVATAEKELEKSIRNEDLLQLMKLQKTLVYFNTSIRGNEVMIGRLKNIFQDTDYLDLELLEDVVIELKQAYNTVNIYSDILTGTMDAFASIISNNVNAIMKRMTSLSITLMIPTLIASFYGMNVDIHLEGFPHAFVFIVLLSAILSAVTFIWFRKIKWF